MTLSLYLLGPFMAKTQHGRALNLTSKKAQALLAYVAMEGARIHYRDALAGLLWADRSDQAARGSLRQALLELRHALDDAAPTPALITSRETIQLDPEADLWLDVAEFEKRATASSRLSPGAPEATEEALRSAVALYRGPLLDGISIDGGPAFDEWLLLKRVQLDRQMLLALSALAALYEGQEAYDEALAYAHRAIALEPWHEEAHRRIMRLLALSGQRSASIEQYRRFERLLVRDLGVQPDPATIALYERIRDGTVVARPSSPSSSLRRKASPGAMVGPEGTAAPALVGREPELNKLAGLLSRALAGEGRVALVTGEAGSGKTALLEGFGRQALSAEGDLLVAVGRCSAHSGAGDAYQSFREIVRMLTGDPEGVLDARHARRLQGSARLAFEALAQQGPDLVRLLARDAQWLAGAGDWAGAPWVSLLEGLAAQSNGPEVADIHPLGLCEPVVRVLQAIARRQPLLLLLDDLQWADAPSLDALFHLGRHLQGQRILVVGAYRTGETGPSSPGRRSLVEIADEFQRQWGDIRVDLAQADGRRFVDAYVDIRPNGLGAGFREALYRHTGGNALFAVELMRAMQERGNLVRDGQGRWVEGPSLSWEHLPPRVEGAISHRIGQLTDAHYRLLAAASVEGEEFHAEVLARVLGLPAEAVVASLSGPLGRQAHLVTPGSVVRVGERQLARYRFRHGLFQSHFYGQLDAADRVRLHGGVGAALVALYGEEASSHAGQLARHFEQAGQPATAADYLLQAGQQAALVGAHREAINCYKRALALLSGLPAAPKRAACELELRTALDHSLMVTLGWGAEERLRVFEQTYELGQQLGWASPGMLGALRSMADYSAARGEYRRATSLANELLVAADRMGEPLYVASAHAILAHCGIVQGHLPEAWEHASQAAAFDLSAQRMLAAGEAHALHPNAEVIVCFLLASMGHLDQARQRMERIATRQDYGVAQRATILSMAAVLYAVFQQTREAQERAEEALRVIGSESLLEVHAWADGILGWAEVQEGHVHQGIERLAAATKSLLEGNTLTLRFLFLGLLAEAHLASGDARSAAEIVAQALAQMEATGARYHESEIWRLGGEIALQGGRSTTGSAAQEVEDCFRRAVEVARRQGARLWELRATTSLGRLWAAQGRPGEARATLSAIYATFSEGRDTPVLQAAKALLAELEAQAGQPVGPAQPGG